MVSNAIGTKAQAGGARKPTGNISTAPNQTLYITNLPSSKIQKPDLRIALYTLFSTYGPVLDVVALRTMKMRGQAHVVFRDVQTATQAMRALQGFEFFGRDMQIQYAKSKSDTIAKLDGSFRMPAAAAGAVTATELQQSIFNAPPSAATTTTTTAPAPGTLKPPAPAVDLAMEDARSPTTSVAGQKRKERDEEDEPEEDSEGDVAMDEDSDDD
ncbi:related to small nuclear ribonucleoprotein U2B [Phialocephala subalpina]|uniref:Related to small nuclear ribonucleoprotein U2B n=1 Tax=Phialocephala subalpina TaxID=576137 RepID=A0A1L7WD36_9HELO|nr:related to small nuclear ribonucleoprotein U2B [Phialocephala subalpina]